jgi:hypothetical protein
MSMRDYTQLYIIKIEVNDKVVLRFHSTKTGKHRHIDI